MHHLPLTRETLGHGTTLSSSFHCTFPQRTLYPVPEYETENSAGTNPLQYNSSPAPPSVKNGRQSQLRNVNNFSMSSNQSQSHVSRAWFRRMMQKPDNQNSERRAHRWRTPVYLIFHVVSLVASTAIVALIAQALISHQKLRHVRQFSGAENAWPRKMSLTASNILLTAAGVNVLKATTCSGIEVHHRTKPYSNRFLILSTVCSALMASMWVPTSVFAEVKRQSDDDFVTWACARSDTAFNQVIPYGAICHEEVVASQLALVVLVIEIVLATSFAIQVIWKMSCPAKS
ncbi:hypothetical protein GJ744_006862 [Endocarpon pusillum]|uniref:Uncharacterized protein n=1 Tax=Endocarpon pusillum TaxID=364733 RepID=A0A8H7ANT8_9EURO|nr:hypothetical protein GJ744_006862 [Endocarpon pusillum]